MGRKILERLTIEVESSLMSKTETRSAAWKWSICGVLLLATLLNYMDRQTLSQTSTDIKAELTLNNTLYGRLETGFGLAFAAGGLITGLLVDLIPVRWMYPLVVLGWSCAGFATAYAAVIGRWLQTWSLSLSGAQIQIEGLTTEASGTYLGLLFCRVILGLFEAGQWPCALVTTQRLLTSQERTFGNSLLQSGASIGAILTPLVVQQLVTDQVGSWRAPFAVIGAVGLLWMIPWFWLVRGDDLAAPSSGGGFSGTPISAPLPRLVFLRRFAVLACIVVTINLTWHYFRAWMPSYLREFLKYDRAFVNYFTSAYYIATDVGCIAVGIATRVLAQRGWKVFSARMATFLLCAVLTSLSAITSFLPRGNLLLILLLLVGFGSLGMFPNYYSFSQDLSTRNQGKITGALSAITWLATAGMQELTGRVVDATGSHRMIMISVGLAPLLGCLALWLFWGSEETSPSKTPA